MTERAPTRAAAWCSVPLVVLLLAAPLPAEETGLAARPEKTLEGVLRRAEIKEIVERADEIDLETSALRVSKACLRSPAILFDLLIDCPPGRERRTLLAAFGQMPAEEVAEFTRGKLEDEPTVNTRLCCLEALAACGASNSLTVCLSIAGDLPPSELCSRRTVDRIGVALGGLLRRHPENLPVVERTYLSMPAAAQKNVLAALQALGGSAAVRVLTELLARGAKPEGEILEMIARQPVTARELHAGSRLRSVREAAESPAPNVRRAAVLAQARLHDTAAFENLIARLGDESLRAAACRSLVKMSGYRLIADPARWSAWFGAEKKWLAESQAGEVAALGGDSSRQRVLVVLRSLARHRLYRDRITAHVLPLTSDRNAEVRRVACETLGELADPEAIPDLHAALGDEDEGVRRAADRALRHVTGLSPAPTARGWASVLELGAPPR